MIVDAFERVASVDGKDVIRQLYLVGHQNNMDTYGHVVFDCGADFCFIHAEMSKKDIKSLRAIKEDILALIEEVLRDQYQYSIIYSYTPNEKFLDYIVKGTGWKVLKKRVTDDVVLCMTNINGEEIKCPSML